MILETNGTLIAEKVTSHSLDADAPLSEQVRQHCFGLVSVINVRSVVLYNTIAQNLPYRSKMVRLFHEVILPLIAIFQ